MKRKYTGYIENVKIDLIETIEEIIKDYKYNNNLYISNIRIESNIRILLENESLDEEQKEYIKNELLKNKVYY